MSKEDYRFYQVMPKGFHIDGFTQIPRVLIRHFSTLDISPGEFCVLLQLISYYFDRGDQPKLSHKRIAESIGRAERQVVRYLRSLEKKGIIERGDMQEVMGGKVRSYKLETGLNKMAKDLYRHNRNKEKMQNTSKEIQATEE